MGIDKAIMFVKDLEPMTKTKTERKYFEKTKEK